jgi:hypothetical protein
MDKKKSGMHEPNPYNEAPGDADSPNISGGGIYVSYDEVMSAHLSTDGASLVSTPNMDSNDGIFGGPAPGEPSAAKPPFKTTG